MKNGVKFNLDETALNKIVGLWGSRQTKKAERYSKSVVPVKSGELKRSIYSDYNTEKQKARIGATAEHAIYIEMGTRKISPRSFLRTAMRMFLKL